MQIVSDCFRKSRSCIHTSNPSTLLAFAFDVTHGNSILWCNFELLKIQLANKFNQWNFYGSMVLRNMQRLDTGHWQAIQPKSKIEKMNPAIPTVFSVRYGHTKCDTKNFFWWFMNLIESYRACKVSDFKVKIAL